MSTNVDDPAEVTSTAVPESIRTAVRNQRRRAFQPFAFLADADLRSPVGWRAHPRTVAASASAHRPTRRSRQRSMSDGLDKVQAEDMSKAGHRAFWQRLGLARD